MPVAITGKNLPCLFPPHAGAGRWQRPAGLLYAGPCAAAGALGFLLMTDTELRKRLVKVIARRARSGEAGASEAAVARVAYDDLAVVLIPLVSEAGFDALVARAFDLARREYPTDDDSAAAARRETEPFAEIGAWLDRHEKRIALDAAAAMFAALAALLITLIGESLTTQYLQKAWPEGFSAARPKGKRA